MPDVALGRGADPFDALLVVSFGGPEGPDEVIPFLENVTRGRGVPPERLPEVGAHYAMFGGVSPINAQNRALVAAVGKAFAEQGAALPVYWGNRNWRPYLADTLRAMADDGVRRAAVLVTSAYASYSGCGQYHENLLAARAEVGESAPELDKLRHYFNHPGFVEPLVDHVVAALERLPESVRWAARLVMTTHSIPVAAAKSAGPQGNAYVRQHAETARLVARGVGRALGRPHVAWDLVFQSRSGPAHVPWLEPDVNTHLAALHRDGVPAAVLVPIGFLSDHMEVVYDLDVEAAATAERLGLPLVRAATTGADPRFAAAVRELVFERAEVLRGGEPRRCVLGTLGPSHDVCPPGCCPDPRGTGTGLRGAALLGRPER
ncbi:ferrochelatase [Yinghuangia sp. ASG 101]|uniref:ferrochelatase n=1 Tax=Yinghuangia sp. ASG 101 TaxID=2896848 RepID=UPI001E545695|nr:ferrochelatase [Yinghuangia sp. ASG 101]UGQ13864.1 ferrochelatase [Yinghuangia sp. ASG 101]